MPQPNQVKQMTREIKFRAYDTRDKKMIIEGFHVFGEAHMFQMVENYCYETKDERGTLMRFNDVDVMQFTGVKDTATGADVYEGDIVKYQHSKDSTEYIGTIHYKEDFASFWLTTNGDTGFALLGAQRVITVLGNIHQHPTLIK